MTSWLSRQRKQAIIDLSNEAGLAQDEDLRKDELIDALDTYLQENATRLSHNSHFEPYYGARRTPFKPRASSVVAVVTSDDGEVKSVIRGRGRRTTKVKQEFEDAPGGASSPIQAIVSTAADAVAAALPRRTPARVRRTALPPSPANIADEVEFQANRLYAGLDDAYSVSGIPETVDYVRELCSSVVGVQMTCLVVEAFALQRALLPWKYVGDLPWVGRLGMSERLAIKLPDFFVLLSGHFWLPTLLWAATSIAVPAVFAYFYNLTMRDVKRHGARVAVARYDADPLTFNVIKALVTWLVYGRGVSFGIVNDLVAARVDSAMLGGYSGVLIGAFIGMLASLYEAIQRK